MTTVGSVSAIIPCAVIAAALVIYCMKHKRKMDQQRADFEAKMENEINAVNSVNKSKILDDHMIVNSLDFPRLKSVNASQGGRTDVGFFGKDKEFEKQAHLKNFKQLNTSPMKNRSSLYCEKLDNSFSYLNS